MKRTRPVIMMAFCAALLTPSIQNAAPVREGVAVYSLPKIKPSGFNVYQGIVEWVPISATQAVAFARNNNRSTGAHSLKSYLLTKTGVASDSRAFASGLGSPRAAAGFWIEGGTPHGLLFVLFEEYDPATGTEFGQVAVAMFDAAGKRTRPWKTLLRIDPGKNGYIADEALHAVRGPASIAVVVSGQFSAADKSSVKNSRVYFLEANLAAGGLIGPVVPLALPAEGKDVYALGSRPDWNGSAWLVPVSATIFEPGKGWEDISANRVLVYTVSAAHAAVANEIAQDGGLTLMAYDTLALAPDPAFAAARLLFVGHRTPLAASRRRLEMFRYDYSLKSLNKAGQLVRSRALSMPRTAHKAAYDPAYKVVGEYDYWSMGVARGEKLYLSNGRTVESAGIHGYRYEQQVNFYEIGLRVAGVEHRARTISLWPEIEWQAPILHAFPGGPLAVVNSAYHTLSPYLRENTITRFTD
jgi:hypothetical protein